MATSKSTIGFHQFANEGSINVRSLMPFVCLCSYLVQILAYLHRHLCHLLWREGQGWQIHRVIIERHMLGSHLTWVTLLRLPIVIALLQQMDGTTAMAMEDATATRKQ